MRNDHEVFWSDDAKNDLRGIIEYLTTRESAEFADKTARVIAQAADRLSYQALLWHTRDTIYPGARFLLVEPYVIVYDVRDTVANIARIVHGAQDIEAIFKTEDDPWL